MRTVLGNLDQQKIVLGLAIALFIGFSVFLEGFAAPDNLLSLLQSVSIIGVLGLGMSVVIIGKGVDLSIVAIMAMPVALSFVLIRDGMSPGPAFLVGFAIAVVAGLINGVLVAYLEVPAIFATLASGMFFFGAIQFAGVTDDVVYAPEAIGGLVRIFQGTLLGVPKTLLVFLGAAGLVWLLLRRTSYGRYVYAIGDNPLTARASGVPVRAVMMVQYAIAAIVALAAGIVLSASIESANTRLFNSTMIYDVVLVVVLGGISLAGGRGSVSNVLVGTLLIGLLINGMTILNLGLEVQNLIRAAILIVALVIDGLLNPRDEQTSQQGDI